MDSNTLAATPPYGTTPVSLAADALHDATLELYDPHDNLTTLTEKNGSVTFTIDQSPRYLHGLQGDP